MLDTAGVDHLRPLELDNVSGDSSEWTPGLSTAVLKVPQTCSISCIWELIRNANSQAPPPSAASECRGVGSGKPSRLMHTDV